MKIHIYEISYLRALGLIYLLLYILKKDANIVLKKEWVACVYTLEGRVVWYALGSTNTSEVIWRDDRCYK